MPTYLLAYRRPTAAATYTAATTAEATALTMAEGETVYVLDVGNGRAMTYRKALASSLPYSLADGQSVLVPDADTEAFSVALALTDSGDFQTGVTDMLFETVRIDGDAPAVRWGPDHVHALDLHGAQWNYGSSSTNRPDNGPMLRLDTGVLPRTPSQSTTKGAVDRLGPNPTMTGRRRTGPYVLVAEDFPGFDPLLWGHPALDGATYDDRVVQAWRNGGAINWAHRLAMVHPSRAVAPSDTVEFAGTVRYPHSPNTDPVTVVGFGDERPTYRMAGEFIAVNEHRYPNDDPAQTSNDDGSIYSNVGLRTTNTSLLKAHGNDGTLRGYRLRGFWADGNKHAWNYRDSAVPLSIADRYAHVRNAPILCTMGGDTGNFTDTDACVVTVEGRCRFTDTWGHNSHSGKSDSVLWSYGAESLGVSARVRFGDPGWDSPHHGTYSFDHHDAAGHKLVEVGEVGADLMGFDFLQVEEVALVNPTERENGYEVLALRRPNPDTRPSYFDVAHVHGALGSKAAALFNTEPGFGPVEARGLLRVADEVAYPSQPLRLLTGGGEWRGTAGPATGAHVFRHGAGGHLALLGSQGGGRAYLRGGDALRLQNVHAALAAGAADGLVSDGEHYANVEVVAGTGAPARLEMAGLDLRASRPGAVAQILPGRMGPGLVLDLRGVALRASNLLRQSRTTADVTAAAVAEWDLLTVVAEGSTLPSEGGQTDGYCRAMLEHSGAFRDVTDLSGRTSEGAPTYTATGSEGLTATVQTASYLGVREVSVSPSAGAPSATVEVLRATVDEAPVRGSTADNRDCRLRLTFASQPPAGATYALAWAVTPQAEWDALNP